MRRWRARRRCGITASARKGKSMPYDPFMVEGGYLRDILAQPRALADTVAGLSGAPALASERCERVVLTGMGASYHALHPLYIQLVERGVQATMVETAELIHYLPALLCPGTLVIAVSQSGRSVEIVRLMEIAAGKVRTIGVTNTPDSPLATRADVTVLTHAGTEASVSCKTYVTMLAALAWLGGAGDVLGQAAPAAQDYLEAWDRKVRALIELLEGTRTVFVIGRGTSVAAAGTGGLILKESAHVAAEGMTCSAFRHGPFELSGPGTVVLVFRGDERTAALNASLAADIRKAGGRAFVIGPDAELEVFRIAAVPAAVRPVLEILPVQLVSLALAALNGHQPGNFRLLTKVTTIE
jgi:glucosamine--fructose-6-phosphate aminotransferase (isomerizing)